MKHYPELKKKILEDMLGKSYDAYVNFKREPLLPKKRQHRQRIPLWRFILHLLHLDEHRIFIEWDPCKEMEFRIKDPAGVASLWGSIKDKCDMTYEKLGRAMRYYYGKNIIEKVAGKRYSYRFILSRKTKKYIDDFSRRNSVSSNISSEGDENSSVSEDHCEFDLKEDECKSPDSGCTELTNDSDEYRAMPQNELPIEESTDFLDFPWQELLSSDRSTNLFYSTSNNYQNYSPFFTFTELKQDQIRDQKDIVAMLNEESPLLGDSLLCQTQTAQNECLLDCKPFSELIFQPDALSFHTAQYFC